MRTILSMICCLILLLSCENNWPPTHDRPNDEAIKKAHSLALLNVEEIDTLNFYYADYFPFHVKFPYKIDTSYYQGGYCGSEPKCKIYRNAANNVEISICQFWSQEPIDYLAEKIDANVFAKQVGRLNQLYNRKTNQEIVERNQVINSQGDHWLLGGVDVTSDAEDHSLLLYGTRLEVDPQYAHMGTYFTMKYLKTKVNQTDAIGQTKFICQKSKFHRVKR